MKYIIGACAGVLLIGVSYYALSPLWDTSVVNDELPASLGIEHLSGEAQRDMMLQLIEANMAGPKMMSETMPPVVASGPFSVVDTPLHPASGAVRVFSQDGKRFIRFEHFKTINGPRLHVYLAKDTSGKEFVDLGPIRGTEGNINYAVPDGVDLDEYPVVMHWCVPFGVLFNYAILK